MTPSVGSPRLGQPVAARHGGKSVCPPPAPSRHVPAEKMRSPRNLLLHGAYLGLYGFFKYWSFPLANILRYAVLRVFSSTIRTRAIGDGVTVFFPWRVKIGRNSTLNQGTLVDGFGGVRIGDGVRIAAYCTINTADHEFDDPDTPIYKQGYRVAGVTIEDDVWIGNHVTVCKGVTIGRGSVIGAGAVVTRCIPPGSIAVGVPCRTIGKRGTTPAPGPASTADGLAQGDRAA